MPRRFESGVEHLRRRLVIDSRWWWHEAGEPNLEALQAAVWEDRVIEANIKLGKAVPRPFGSRPTDWPPRRASGTS